MTNTKNTIEVIVSNNVIGASLLTIDADNNVTDKAVSIIEDVDLTCGGKVTTLRGQVCVAITAVLDRFKAANINLAGQTTLLLPGSAAMRFVGLPKVVDDTDALEEYFNKQMKSLTTSEAAVWSAAATELAALAKTTRLVVRNGATLFKYSLSALDTKLSIPMDLKAGDEIVMEESKCAAFNLRTYDVTTLKGTYHILDAKQYQRKNGEIGVEYSLLRESYFGDERINAAQLQKMLKADPEGTLAKANGDSQIAWATNMLMHLEITSRLPKPQVAKGLATVATRSF